ncbi:capsule assembly Wzi family protein [Mongoliitalea lutea]|uniref:Capsule assembly protein Wzi n=1 Tax=Mongoliitalea lutea TaxID=849756 RepID=A0A8J3CWQ0_9BACT|nr:capsule assembly Wzi family protein [Mongoliitalea lutea]GHB37046.1 hypothetical protein GCM10008106_17910 [Mongoliitalea lutea]
MRTLLVICFFCIAFFAKAQVLHSNYPVLEEHQRRLSLLDTNFQAPSFNLRPIANDFGWSLIGLDSGISRKSFDVRILPILNTVRYNSNRPYGWGEYGMIPNVGWQSYTTTGFFARWKFISLQVSPEFHAAQNLSFKGYQDNLGNAVHAQSFILWNYGDYPERFGDLPQRKFHYGQSKFALGYGAFEMGVSSMSLWWGPGQFTSLTFSNNAQSFPYLTINTRKPAKTFLGNFEGQLISGRIDDSGLAPLQNQELNDRFFTPFTGDWKYVNAITISYNPKWIPGLYGGLTRTAQIYRQNMNINFGDLFPVFEGVTKEQFFDENNTTVEFDSDGRDQQVTAFLRLLVPKFNMEFYVEYGRRDHPLNWRELTLNPEHARAYLMGFNKLVSLASSDAQLQIRGEMVQQHESINRIIRYGPRGGITWHTHNVSRGFSNNGRALGTGIGLGSNVQILEVSRIKNLNKIGLIFQRLENNQTLFHRSFFDNSERQPWVDYSVGLLIDHQWKNLILSSRFQHIHARNYQWQLAPTSTELFPVGYHMNSFHGQFSVIYLWGNR